MRRGIEPFTALALDVVIAMGDCFWPEAHVGENCPQFAGPVAPE